MAAVVVRFSAKQLLFHNDLDTQPINRVPVIGLKIDFCLRCRRLTGLMPISLSHIVREDFYFFTLILTNKIS
jgi:hypothetical protein